MYDLKIELTQKHLLHLVARNHARKNVIDMPDIAWDLIDAAEKPLTIIYQEVKGIAHNALLKTVLVPSACQKIIFANNLYKLGKPLISTSANTSGTPTPQSFQDIEPSILSGVDYVVNLRRKKNARTHLLPSSCSKIMAK